MSLKIKGTEEPSHEIDLEQADNRVRVRIDGEIMATFKDNGEFVFYGHSSQKILEARWKE